MHGSGRVLVVDDDESIRQFVQLALSDEGYEVLTAADGGTGLRLAADHDLDLILLDLRMPGVDGWTFVREYRQQAGEPAPIIALTAAHEPEEHAAATPVAALLAKPFDLDDLLDLVAYHLRREEVDSQ